MKLLAIVLAVAAAYAMSASAAVARTETPLDTPGSFPAVMRSLVTIDAPMPADVSGVPAECQRLSYYRYRNASGPTDRQEADAILVGMPGILGGAASLEMNALQVVQRAAETGRSVEYWALDRRTNCLEDRRGLDAAKRAGDMRRAVDYYYRGASIDGKKFAGWGLSKKLRWLKSVDLRQVLEDERAVIVDGLPDPHVRETKTFCGGHSLGGLITGLFLAWDFDGDKATSDDAGSRLCGAGSFALDTLVTADPIGLQTLPDVNRLLRLPMGLGHKGISGLIARGDIPRLVDFGFINPQVISLLSAVALNAKLAPQADSAPLIASVPDTPSVKAALRFFHSGNGEDARAPVPLLRRQHLTGEALLGAFIDDNTQPLAFTEASIGMYDDGPLLRKRYPFSPNATSDPILGFQLGSQPLVVPAGNELRGWRRYDESLPDHRRANGAPVTSAASEVTDIRDIERTFGEGPLDFVEAYFPMQLVVDVLFGQAGDRGGDLSSIRYPQAPRGMPRVTLLGGESFTMRILKVGLRDLPSDLQVIPGYQHLDIVTASPQQPGGGKEPVAEAVTELVIEHIPAA
ncbi:MAG: hypothetical protein JHC95_10300 [Solirubrobacteraceae bacterium]|nr:hypothetical protein [Solirubrobacteraceae bacterium]